MKVKENKKTKNKKINIFTIVFLILIVYFSFTFLKQQFQINELNLELKDLNTKIVSKQLDTEEIKELSTKTSDPEYIEKLAREKLNLIKPYEKIFVDVNK